jgi:hypothetical protein
MIRTERFALTSQEYFKIIVTTYLKKRWWIISLLLLFGLLLSLRNEKDSFEYFLMFFAFFYPIIVLISFWRYSKSKDNKLFLVERFYEISEDSLTGILSDGSESIIKKDNFIKTVELTKYYLLYISKNQFIIFPKKAFINQQDKDWFIFEYIKKITK